MKTKLEKAKEYLKSKYISCIIHEGNLFVSIADTQLELGNDEVEYRARLWEEEYFDNNFTLVKNHINGDDASWGGCMFETYDEELDYICEKREANPKQIWSIVEGDKGEYVCAGFQRVNVLGYLITEEEWSDENEEYSYGVQ